MPPLIYAIRHGQTDWNAQARLQGQADTDLNATGRAQADGNGRRLAGLIGDAEEFDFVASPLRRTRETMERVRSSVRLPSDGYRTDARLVEVHFGAWQGWTYEDLEADTPGCTQARSRDKWGFVPPGRDGESYAMLAERVATWLAEIEQPTVCVTHGGVIRGLLHLLTDMPPDEAVLLDIPQDRILRIVDGKASWI